MGERIEFLLYTCLKKSGAFVITVETIVFFFKKSKDGNNSDKLYRRSFKHIFDDSSTNNVKCDKLSKEPSGPYLEFCASIHVDPFILIDRCLVTIWNGPIQLTYGECKRASYFGSQASVVEESREALSHGKVVLLCKDNGVYKTLNRLMRHVNTPHHKLDSSSCTSSEVPSCESGSLSTQSTSSLPTSTPSGSASNEGSESDRDELEFRGRGSHELPVAHSDYVKDTSSSTTEETGKTERSEMGQDLHNYPKASKTDMPPAKPNDENLASSNKSLSQKSVISGTTESAAINGASSLAAEKKTKLLTLGPEKTVKKDPSSAQTPKKKDHTKHVSDSCKHKTEHDSLKTGLGVAQLVKKFEPTTVPKKILIRNEPRTVSLVVAKKRIVDRRPSTMRFSEILARRPNICPQCQIYTKHEYDFCRAPLVVRCNQCGTIAHPEKPECEHRPCWRCGGDGHWRRECSQPPAIRCYRCGELGHGVDECENARFVRCSRCGDVGHTRFVCPVQFYDA